MKIDKEIFGTSTVHFVRDIGPLHQWIIGNLKTVLPHCGELNKADQIQNEK